LKCANHSERDSAAKCGLCGNNFCEECLVRFGAADYCRECLEKKMKEVKVSAGPDYNNTQAAVRTKDKKSRFWAFVFSLVPGVGYLYLGLMNRGLQAMVLFFGSIFVASFIGFGEIMTLVAPVVVFYSIFETQQLVKQINAGELPEDKQFFDYKSISFSHKWIGYGFVAVGSLALIRKMPFFFPFWDYFSRILPPLVIIGIGVAILYSNTKREN